MGHIGEEIGFGAIGGLGLRQRLLGKAPRPFGVLPSAGQHALGMTAIEQRAKLQAVVVEQGCIARGIVRQSSLDRCECISTDGFLRNAYAPRRIRFDVR